MDDHVAMRIIIAILLAIVACSVPDLDLLGSARKPLVLVGGQTEQIPSTDYISSFGGASFNSTPPTAAGDVEADTFNGIHLTGSGGTGSVSVAISQFNANSPSLITTNLTTEGTIDWIAASGTNVDSYSEANPKKATGGASLAAPGIYPWNANNTGAAGFFASTCASCSFGITWTTGDSTSSVAAPGNPGYRGWNSYNGGGGSTDQGWVFNAPAATTQRVLRQYFTMTYTTGGYCVGSLSDGSGSATTIASPVNTGGTGSWVVKLTWTYHAASLDGGQFIVVCRLGSPGTSGAGGSSIAWFAETLAPT